MTSPHPASGAVKGAAVRPVGSLQLLALGVNGIVGVGIFVAPAAIAAHAPGRAISVVFILTGVLLLPVAWAFSTLGRRFDVDGGPVIFARAAFGERASFLIGWIAYVSAFSSTSAVISGLSTAIAPTLNLTGMAGPRVLSILLATGLAAAVASGIRVSAQTWTTLTVLKLLPLLALVGAWCLTPRAALPGAVWPPVQLSWLGGVLGVMFAFQGFEIVPVIAGQVRAPGRAIPFATVGSLVVAMVFYAVLVTAASDALPRLSESVAPLADAARVLGGPLLGAVLVLGTSASAFAIAFGMMVTTPRYLAALAPEGGRLWDVGRVDRAGVPRRALGCTLAIVTLVLLLGDLAELFALASIAVLAQYGVTGAALCRLALSRKASLRPVDAWPALPTMAVAVALPVFGASAREVIVALVVGALGVVLSLFPGVFPPRRAI